MGTLLAAFAAFVLSALYLLPLPEGIPPAEFAPYRDFAFMALALYIVVAALLRKRAPAAPPPEPAAEAGPSPQEIAARDEAAQAGGALVLLSQLQEKGRFLDFLMEDITAYQDAQVAAASRVVHQGCAAVMREYFDIAPLHGGKEGERITADTAADPDRYRLSGKLSGNGPYQGVVVHRGWRTTKLALPRYTRPVDPAQPTTIAPIEVEVR